MDFSYIQQLQDEFSCQPTETRFNVLDVECFSWVSRKLVQSSNVRAIDKNEQKSQDLVPMSLCLRQRDISCLGSEVRQSQPSFDGTVLEILRLQTKLGSQKKTVTNHFHVRKMRKVYGYDYEIAQIQASFQGDIDSYKYVHPTSLWACICYSALLGTILGYLTTFFLFF